MYVRCRSQWPRGLRRGCAAARLMEFRVQISPAVWVSVSYACCVLSDRGLCDRPILLSEESYRVWCVGVWCRNFQWSGPGPTGALATKKRASRVQGLWRHAVLISNSLRVRYFLSSDALSPTLYLCFQGLTSFVQHITSFARALRFQSKVCVFV